MSDRAQAMLFEAFARSFFAQPGALSAAELIAMFHYYFLGNPEGIGFDAPDTDYLTCIWAPLRGVPGQHGGGRAHRHPGPGARAGRRHRWRVETDDGGARRRGTSCWRIEPGALRDLVAASPGAAAPRRELARQGRAACAVAPPFAVARLWLDRDVAPGPARRSAR